jgi:hypothetical protein
MRPPATVRRTILDVIRKSSVSATLTSNSFVSATLQPKTPNSFPSATLQNSKKNSMPENQSDLQYPTCNHIRSDGSFCMSPAMKNHPLCYYHARDRQRRRNLRHAADLQNSASHRALSAHQRADELMRSLGFPDLEDPASVQIALTTVARALAFGHLEPRRASLLIRVLRAAIVNLKNLPHLEPTDDIAAEDPEPIAPLITPCAPEPWEVPAFDCHPEERSAEGPLLPSEMSSEQEAGNRQPVEELETKNEEPSVPCHPEEQSDEGPLPPSTMPPACHSERSEESAVPLPASSAPISEPERSYGT